MKSYLLEIIAFVVGATIMVLELVASRILAPYVGTSLVVWSSLIGVVLGSLSLGYWLGGKISDKNPSLNILSVIILLSSLSLFTTAIFQHQVLSLLSVKFYDIRATSILSSLTLFLIPNTLLGMITPFIIKLKLKTMRNTGSTSGNLYAVSTVGSIFGTFSAGFILIPSFGSYKLLLILSAILALLYAFLTIFGGIFKAKIKYFSFLFLFFMLITSLRVNDASQKNTITFDTQYNRVTIKDYFDTNSNKHIRLLMFDNLLHSAMYLSGDTDTVLGYNNFYDLAKYFNPNLKKSLMIGGGAYTYPQYYLKKNPNSYIDVVEIDPGLTNVAKKYFGLKDNPRLKIYNEDGRTFLNRNDTTYDAILNDAFQSFYPPFQLTTKEAIANMYRSLNERGVVITNIISSIDSGNGKILRAELATYKSSFPYVYIFPVTFPENGNIVQNIILVALKSKIDLSDKDTSMNPLLSHMWKNKIAEDIPVLTDDFAPVEQYLTIFHR